jgi:hypothetical protein
LSFQEEFSAARMNDWPEPPYFTSVCIYLFIIIVNMFHHEPSPTSLSSICFMGHFNNKNESLYNENKENYNCFVLAI